MQFHRTLALAILGSAEHGGRQLADAAVQAHQLVLEAELGAGARYRLGLALTENLREDKLVEFPRSIGVGTGEGRSLSRASHRVSYRLSWDSSGPYQCESARESHLSNLVAI